MDLVLTGPLRSPGGLPPGSAEIIGGSNGMRWFGALETSSRAGGGRGTVWYSSTIFIVLPVAAPLAFCSAAARRLEAPALRPAPASADGSLNRTTLTAWLSDLDSANTSGGATGPFSEADH